jgi:hypothetical protein
MEFFNMRKHIDLKCGMFYLLEFERYGKLPQSKFYKGSKILGGHESEFVGQPGSPDRSNGSELMAASYSPLHYQLRQSIMLAKVN